MKEREYDYEGVGEDQCVSSTKTGREETHGNLARAIDGRSIESRKSARCRAFKQTPTHL